MTGRAAGYPPLSVGFIGAIPASKITECITEPAPFAPVKQLAQIQVTRAFLASLPRLLNWSSGNGISAHFDVTAFTAAGILP